MNIRIDFRMHAAPTNRSPRRSRGIAAATLMAIASCVLSAMTTRAAGVEDWPQFRGADSRGVADNPGLVERWSTSENILWSQPIEGRGWSSPIVVAGRVFLTTVRREEGEPEEAKPGLYFGGDRKKIAEVMHEWQMLCFDLATGEPRWKRTLHQAIPSTPRHIKNSYASETPVSDGERVYALFGDVGVHCLTLDGDVVWSRDLPQVATRYGWGTAASPVLDEGRLYIVCDNEEASYLLALDARTGEQIFQVDRDEKSNWATPFVWKNELRTELITPGTGKVRSYDLEGNLLYEFGGCSSITIAMPYADRGLLYVSSGYIMDQKRPLFAIRPGASGDISLADEETSNEFIAWCQKQGAPDAALQGHDLRALRSRIGRRVRCEDRG